ERPIDSIRADVENVLAGLREGRSSSGRALTGAAVNRYRIGSRGCSSRLCGSAWWNGIPVTGIPKHRESSGRITYLTEQDELAISEALAPKLRPAFLAAVNLGFRLSEQRRLAWQDVDMLTGNLAVHQSKNCRPRAIPMNSVVRR